MFAYVHGGCFSLGCLQISTFGKQPDHDPSRVSSSGHHIIRPPLLDQREPRNGTDVGVSSTYTCIFFSSFFSLAGALVDVEAVLTKCAADAQTVSGRVDTLTSDLNAAVVTQSESIPPSSLPITQPSSVQSLRCMCHRPCACVVC